MRFDDLALLRCPDCHAALAAAGAARPPRGPLPDEGTLLCVGCAATWPVRDGLPRLYHEEEVSGTDWVMRLLYDKLGAFHDPAVRYILPLVQFGSERSLRDGYMRRLELDKLRPRADGRPLRILETGIGGGANVALLRRDLPSGLDVEIWGLDLSEQMLGDCRRLLARNGERDVRLLMADAHRLPFDDHSFDRVFHVGGIGGYRDPRTALAEMARVAEPDTPIVVVDEQLDASERNSLYHRFWFRVLTFYDPDPHCPRELLPAGARDVIEEQVSRFYYCLTFRS